jgi:hypothetical protein
MLDPEDPSNRTRTVIDGHGINISSTGQTERLNQKRNVVTKGNEQGEERVTKQEHKMNEGWMKSGNGWRRVLAYFRFTDEDRYSSLLWSLGALGARRRIGRCLWWEGSL